MSLHNGTNQKKKKKKEEEKKIKIKTVKNKIESKPELRVAEQRNPFEQSRF